MGIVGAGGGAVGVALVGIAGIVAVFAAGRYAISPRSGSDRAARKAIVATTAFACAATLGELAVGLTSYCVVEPSADAVLSVWARMVGEALDPVVLGAIVVGCASLALAVGDLRRANARNARAHARQRRKNERFARRQRD